MEEDFAEVNNRKLEEVQSCTENIDIFLRKNNLRLKGFKEHTEGNDLHAYWQQLFCDLEGLGSPSKILTFSAFRIGCRNVSAKFPRDILIRFSNWESKAQALELINQNPEIGFGGSCLNFFLDISHITLKKRRNFRFLTSKLQKANINYQWGYI